MSINLLTIKNHEKYTNIMVILQCNAFESKFRWDETYFKPNSTMFMK